MDYKIPADFNLEDFKEIIKQYKGSDIFAPAPAIYSIPFSDFQYAEKDPRHIALYKYTFETLFTYLKIPVIIKLCYNTSNLVILEVNNIMMLERVLIDLDYGKRDKHIEIIKEISALVSEDGKLGLFVSNVPYWLELTLVVSTTENYEKIIEIAANHNLQLDYSRHIPELMEDFIKRRCYDFTEIGSETTYNEINNILNTMCHFPTISELRRKGYFPPSAKKEKVIYFILP